MRIIFPENLSESSRWYSIKVFERDKKVLETLNISDNVKSKIENYIKEIEEEYDDDAESIIISEKI